MTYLCLSTRIRKKAKEMTKYLKILEAGETVKEGDLFKSMSGSLAASNCAGHQVTDSLKECGYYRPVEIDDWHEIAKEGMPQEKDRDAHGEVQWITDRGVSTCSVLGVATSYGEITHWRRIIPPFPVEHDIYVGGHVVKFQSDRVTVGCRTVLKETMDKIMERWQKQQQGEKK